MNFSSTGIIVQHSKIETPETFRMCCCLLVVYFYRSWIFGEIQHIDMLSLYAVEWYVWQKEKKIQKLYKIGNTQNWDPENIVGEMGFGHFGVPEFKQKIIDINSHYWNILQIFFRRLLEILTAPCKTNQSPKQFLPSDCSYLNRKAFQFHKSVERSSRMILISTFLRRFQIHELNPTSLYLYTRLINWIKNLLLIHNSYFINLKC